MPRQPYLPTFQHLNYAIGAFVLKDRPDFCAAIGKCIALWGQVDNEMGNLFSLLLGANSAPALEVFLTLRRLSNQREALKAAAKHKLKDQDLRVFEAIQIVYTALEKERNSLAHGCFGISDDDRNVLYWIDLKHHVQFQTEALVKESQSGYSASDDRHAQLKENMFVYRLSDLETLYSQMEEFWWAAFYFNCYLREPKHPARIDDVARLSRFTQIARALSDLTAKFPKG